MSAGMNILNLMMTFLYCWMNWNPANFKLTVLSNKPHEFTLLAVKHLLPNWEFELVLGQREGIPRKPDPAGMIDICEQLKIPAKSFLYLGDTATDMKTATSAGCFPVGVLWGFRPEKETERKRCSSNHKRTFGIN